MKGVKVGALEFESLGSRMAVFGGFAVVISCWVGCTSRTCAPSGESGCGYPTLMPGAISRAEINRSGVARDIDGCIAMGGKMESPIPPRSCRMPNGSMVMEFFSPQGRAGSESSSSQ